MPEPDTFVIRPLRSDEYASVCTVWQAAGLPTRAAGRDSADAFARQLERNSTTYLAAELDGRLVGVVLGTNDGRKGWINRLAVDPAHRKRGVAKRLLLACEAALGELGIEIVAALIEHGNDASVAAFESAGYQADVPVHYYRKRRRSDI